MSARRKVIVIAVPNGAGKTAFARELALSALAIGNGQVLEVASIPVGAAPRRDGTMGQPPGSPGFAGSRRGGAPTVGLPVEPPPSADIAQEFLPNEPGLLK